MTEFRIMFILGGCGPAGACEGTVDGPCRDAGGGGLSVFTGRN